MGAAEAWDALKARPPASLSGSRAWLTAAFATVHRDAEPFLLAVDVDGRLAALLTLALHHRDTKPVLRFAGAPHNDLTDLIALPGYEEVAGDAVIQALGSAPTRGWSVNLEDVDPDGLLAAADRRIRRLAWAPDDPAPAVDLRGEWRSAASPRRRRAWDRALRRLQDRHAVRFRHFAGSEAVCQLPEFLRLRSARIEATGRTQLPPIAFVTHAVGGLASAGACAIMELLVDDRPVASDLYLLDPPVAMLWLRGLDPRWRRFPCGHLLLRASAEELARRGFDLLDLGRGDEPYKFHFGAHRRSLLRARLPTEPSSLQSAAEDGVR